MIERTEATRALAISIMNYGLLLGCGLMGLWLALVFVAGNQHEGVIFVAGLLLVLNLLGSKLRLYMNSGIKTEGRQDAGDPS